MKDLSCNNMHSSQVWKHYGRKRHYGKNRRSKVDNTYYHGGTYEEDNLHYYQKSNSQQERGHDYQKCTGTQESGEY